MHPKLDQATLYLDSCEFWLVSFKCVLSVCFRFFLETPKNDKADHTENERYLSKYCINVIYVTNVIIT